MSQSQIASTRAATAAEGRMLVETPSGTMRSPPQLAGCNSSRERPIGCIDTRRKAPCCGRSRKKPKPNATPHLALGVFGGFPWLFQSQLLPLKHFATRQRHAGSSHRPENPQESLGKAPSPGRGSATSRGYTLSLLLLH